MHAQFQRVLRWPATENQIVAFIAYLSLKHMAPSTIASYVSGLSYVHKINMLPDPTNNFLVRKIIEGTRRQNRAEDGRLPITFEILTKLVSATQSVCSNTIEAALFSAAFSLAYFAFLRISEFTLRSKTANPSLILQRNDIAFDNNHMTFILRHAKNNQHNIPTKIQLSRLQTHGPCPVACMTKYLKLTRHKVGPVFMHMDGSPLTRFQFLSVLRKCLLFCDLDTSKFKSHSFRIGAASSCSAAGVSMATIQKWGRWRSSAVNSYIRPVNKIMSQNFKL